MYVVYVYDLAGREINRYHVPTESEANYIAYHEQCNGNRTRVAARQLFLPTLSKNFKRVLDRVELLVYYVIIS